MPYAWTPTLSDEAAQLTRTSRPWMSGRFVVRTLPGTVGAVVSITTLTVMIGERVERLPAASTASTRYSKLPPVTLVSTYDVVVTFVRLFGMRAKAAVEPAARR